MKIRATVAAMLTILLIPVFSAAQDVILESSTSTGWYMGGSYRFIDWFELGGYYSRSNYDDDKDSNTEYSVYFFSELDDICTTVRFDINRYWAVKLEAHSFKGTYPVNALSSDLTEVTSKSVEDEWRMYAAKMTVAF